ncbi:hypothetical protein nrt1_61600 [Pseudomonas aeruginosa]
MLTYELNPWSQATGKACQFEMVVGLRCVFVRSKRRARAAISD